MEDHLKNQNRLEKEWEALCGYQAEPNASTTGLGAGNTKKNRSNAVVACELFYSSFKRGGRSQSFHILPCCIERKGRTVCAERAVNGIWTPSPSRIESSSPAPQLYSFTFILHFDLSLHYRWLTSELKYCLKMLLDIMLLSIAPIWDYFIWYMEQVSFRFNW